MPESNETIFEKVIESPARALESTVESSRQLIDEVINKTPLKELGRAKEYWQALGPGLTTGASDDDPSGIATYSQTGAQYGFKLLWLAPFTFPLMAVIQEMCARIGLVTGRGLAANIRLLFPRQVLIVCTVLLFLANSLNIGADLGAMAKATQLLVPNAHYGQLVLVFTLLSLLLQIFSTYERYAKYLKWLALVLLAYVFSGLIVELDWTQVLMSAITPSLSFSRDQLYLICAILGTTISPYLFFWQTSQEVEEMILDGKTTLKLRQEEASGKEIRNMRIDVWSGMFLSNVVMFFIIATCAATLYKNGITNIETAEQAALALRPIAGEKAYILFSLGIIGTGLLAVPVLAGSASYALSESFGWKYGLYKKLKQAYAFYGVIILSMLVGLGINFSGLDPIKALIYSAVANGLVAPVVLVLILLISSNEKVMGKHKNGRLTQGLGWLITVLMIIAGAAAVYSLFFK